MKLSIIAVVGIVTIGTLIGGNLHWNQKVDATTQKAKQSLNVAHSESSTKSSTNVTNTENSTSAKSTSHSNASNLTETNSTEKNTTETHKDIEDTTSSHTNGDKKKTVAEIKKEYNTLFSELEALETSKVDQLVVQAKADYISKKGTKTEMIAKYQAVSQQLEAQADQSFNAIYQQLQYDLEMNGYNLNEAQQFQQTYNSKKASRTSRIASQIRGF